MGKRRPRMSTEPCRPGARGPSRSSGPHSHSAASLMHQHQREGGQQLEQLGRAVDAPQQQHLDQRAEHADRQRRQQQRRPEAQARAQLVDQRVGDVDAQHVERAMREVDDAGDAEDQRQARRHQEQRRRAGQPVEQLDDESGEGHAAQRLAVIAGEVHAAAAVEPAVPARGAGRRTSGRRAEGAAGAGVSPPGAASSPRHRSAGTWRRRGSRSRPSCPCPCRSWSGRR